MRIKGGKRAAKSFNCIKYIFLFPEQIYCLIIMITSISIATYHWLIAVQSHQVLLSSFLNK